MKKKEKKQAKKEQAGTWRQDRFQAIDFPHPLPLLLPPFLDQHLQHFFVKVLPWYWNIVLVLLVLATGSSDEAIPPWWNDEVTGGTLGASIAERVVIEDVIEVAKTKAGTFIVIVCWHVLQFNSSRLIDLNAGMN